MNVRIYLVNGEVIETNLDNVFWKFNGNWIHVKRDVGYSYYPREQILEIRYLGA
jgi:hypothetical protein